MKDIQEIFNRIQGTKKKQKEIRDDYKDALVQSERYQQANDELKAARVRKKEIELSIKEEFANEFDKLEVLKTDIESDTMLMSDVALNRLVKGEKIEIKDQHDNEYEPIFTVKFKKVK